ncbi:hypothetical protein DEM27_31630 [Metarhizobium album]|uniref:DUF4747 domain-containing protein n=1 Tax=Metarhizobium album TaxID=2182425 RepID=A0A2U2DG44_9HYPH|nr:hypothetical protein [Rhizobium album]PWE52293.1 hypothetical protein DEM27_31630 [Rhizobium album]
MAGFEYLRLSLAKPDQMTLLGSDGSPARDITRRFYLERVFNRKRLDFDHYGRTFSFLTYGIFGDILVGRIGRQALEPIHSGPDDDYAIAMIEDWKTAWFLLDLSSSSQLIAMQTGMAATKALIESLFASIENKTPGHEYVAFVEYVSNAQDFWSAVDKYRGRLTRLEFTFVPPNALGLEEEIRAIVDAAKAVGSEKTKFTHTNSQGALDPKGEYIEAALKTTSDGAGSVEMKAGKKIVFSSAKNRKTVDVPTEDLPASKDEALIGKLTSMLFGTAK